MIRAAAISVLVLTAHGSVTVDQANPRISGWIAETVRLDLDDARAAYEHGATRADRIERALCLARLLELDAARGDRAAMAQRRRELAALGVTDLVETDLQVIANTHDAIQQARALGEPEQIEAMDAIREALVEHNRDRVRQPTTYDAVFERVTDGQQRTVDERRVPMRTRASVRRNWLAVVERTLADRIDDAARIATHNLGWEPATLPTDVATFVEQRLELVQQMRSAQTVESLEHELLSQVEERVGRLTADGAIEHAAGLLRRIPLFGR